MKFKALCISGWICSLMLSGCSKKAEEPAEPEYENYSIKIYKGNDQTDTIGHELKDSIIVQGMLNGKPVTGGKIQFITSGCDINSVFEEIAFSGNNRFIWKLNAIVGEQKLKVIYTDKLGMPRDTVMLTANAVMPDRKGWQPCPCDDGQNHVIAFARFKSGKLFALPANSSSLLYSDNGGVQWHKMKSLPGNSIIRQITATDDDGLFILAAGAGIFYSSNAGQSWEPRNNQIANFNDLYDFRYVEGGRMYARGSSGGYTSGNSGLSWKLIDKPWGEFHVIKHPNGNVLYLNDGIIRSSSDNGETYQFLASLGYQQNTNLLFLDKQNYLYATGSINYSTLLFRSKDLGTTWEPLYTAPQDPDRRITDLSWVNGLYYFYAAGAGIMATTDFSEYTSLAPDLTKNARTFMTKSDGGMVMGTTMGSLYYYIP